MNLPSMDLLYIKNAQAWCNREQTGIIRSHPILGGGFTPPAKAMARIGASTILGMRDS